MERSGSLKRSRRPSTSTSTHQPTPQYAKISKTFFRRPSTSHPTEPPPRPHTSNADTQRSPALTPSPNDHANGNGNVNDGNHHRPTSSRRGSLLSHRPFDDQQQQQHPQSSTPPPNRIHLFPAPNDATNDNANANGNGLSPSDQLRQFLHEFDSGKRFEDIRIPINGDGNGSGEGSPDFGSVSGSGSGSASFGSGSEVGSGEGHESGGSGGRHRRESTYEKVLGGFERGIPPSSALASSVFTSLVKRAKGEKKRKEEEREKRRVEEERYDDARGGAGRESRSRSRNGGVVGGERQTLDLPHPQELPRDSTSSLGQSSLAQYSILSRPPPRSSQSHLLGGAGPSDPTNYPYAHNPFLGLRSTPEQNPAVEYHDDVGIEFGSGEFEVVGRRDDDGDAIERGGDAAIEREVRLAIPSITLPHTHLDSGVEYPGSSVYSIPLPHSQFPQPTTTTAASMGTASMNTAAARPPRPQPPRPPPPPTAPPRTTASAPPYTQPTMPSSSRAKTTTTTMPIVDMPVPPVQDANAQTHSHHHKSHSHSHSKSRHQKSSSHPTTSSTLPGGTTTATSVSNLIMYTTTRLSEETTRANAAERQMGEALAIVRNAVKEREEAKMRLTTVQEELRMYKRELEVAQQEILRAQEVLAKVERERLDAETRATRDRAKLRKLLEEKAVRKALEEGRRMGFEQGLDTGRQMAWEDDEFYHRHGHGRGRASGKRGRRDQWTTTEDEASTEYPRWSPPLSATATSVGGGGVGGGRTANTTAAQIGPSTRASSVPPVPATRSEPLAPPPISKPPTTTINRNPEPPQRNVAPPPPINPPQTHHHHVHLHQPSPTPPSPKPVHPPVLPTVQVGPSGYPIPPPPVLLSRQSDGTATGTGTGTNTPSSRSSKSRPLPQPPRPASAAPMTSTSTTSSTATSSRPTYRARSGTVGTYAPVAPFPFPIPSTSTSNQGRPRSSSASVIPPPAPPIEHMEMPEPIFMPEPTVEPPSYPDPPTIRPTHTRDRSGSSSNGKGKEVVRDPIQGRYESSVDPSQIPPPYGFPFPVIPPLTSIPTTNPLDRIKTPPLGQFDVEKTPHKPRDRDRRGSRVHRQHTRSSSQDQRHSQQNQHPVYPSALPVPFYGGKAVTTSTTSTRLSQLDLVSPPKRHHEREPLRGDSSSQRSYSSAGAGSGGGDGKDRRRPRSSVRGSLGHIEEGTESRSTSEDIVKDWRAGNGSPSPMPTTSASTNREEGRRRGMDMIYSGVTNGQHSSPILSGLPPGFTPTSTAVLPHVVTGSPHGQREPSLGRTDSQRTRRSSGHRTSNGEEVGIDVEPPSRPASEADAPPENNNLLSPETAYTALPTVPTIPIVFDPVVETPTTPKAPSYQQHQDQQQQPFQPYQPALPQYEYTQEKTSDYPIYPIAQPPTLSIITSKPGKENYEAITGFVSDTKSLPSGFVPLSPIPTLSNISTLPPAGSVPGTPKGGMDQPLKPSNTSGKGGFEVEKPVIKNTGRARKGVRGKA